MVLGIGIDIIEIERIKESVDEYGDSFLKKIYRNWEGKLSEQIRHPSTVTNSCK